MIDFEKNATMRMMQNTKIIDVNSPDGMYIQEILDGCGIDLLEMASNNPDLIMAIGMIYRCGAMRRKASRHEKA